MEHGWAWLKIDGAGSKLVLIIYQYRLVARHLEAWDVGPPLFAVNCECLVVAFNNEVVTGVTSDSWIHGMLVVLLAA